MIEPVYSAAENRYECGMQYRRAGRSGVMPVSYTHLTLPTTSRV